MKTDCLTCMMNNNVIFAENVCLNSSVFNRAVEVVPYSMADCKRQFEQVYNSNYKKVVFFANNYLNDYNEAESIAHDAFYALWKNIENVEKEKMAPYVFVVAKNMCLNYLRKRNLSKQYSSQKSKEGYLNMIALENSPSLNIYEKDVRDIVNKGLGTMKEKVRRTFLLSRSKGLKNREIAEIEGVVESTIEARISVALLIMRKMLDDYIK